MFLRYHVSLNLREKKYQWLLGFKQNQPKIVTFLKMKLRRKYKNLEEIKADLTGSKNILRELGKLYLIRITEQEILLENMVDLQNKTDLTCVRFLKKMKFL